MLYSIGKDSGVMLHLAAKAFYPSKPPFPLLHVDTQWKFRDMYKLRDQVSERYGFKLLVYTNEDGVKRGINPIASGSSLHTQVMKTEALKQALDQYGFDAAFGGARRDEEKSRAKERIFSFRSAGHVWDPRNQRPELWNLYNTRISKGETIRVFPLSNWTELDIWEYTYAENLPIVPLYLAAERPVVKRDGMLIMRDDDRMPLLPGETEEIMWVRFRSLGCYPLSARGGVQGHHARAHHRRDARGPHLRAPGPPDRLRRGRLDGEEEAGGLFLMADSGGGMGPEVLEETKGLLRFLTCGSVDDGKSTLIGRLLYDSKLIFEDQLAALERDSRKHGTVEDDIDFALLVDGLEAERAAGHHHRRRLPLLQHAQALVHRRRHARPRAVHAQHGHRRLQLRPGDHPDRRAQGRADPDQAAQLHLLAAGHPPRGGGGEQDRPGGLRPGPLRRDRRRLPQPSPTTLGFESITPIPMSARFGDNVTSQLRQDALVRRPRPGRLPGDHRRRERWRRPSRSASRCSG